MLSIPGTSEVDDADLSVYIAKLHVTCNKLRGLNSYRSIEDRLVDPLHFLPIVVVPASAQHHPSHVKINKKHMEKAKIQKYCSKFQKESNAIYPNTKFCAIQKNQLQYNNPAIS